MVRQLLRALLLLAAGGLLVAGCEMGRARTPGERLWRKLCAGCHGLDAAGNTPQMMGETYADLRDDFWRTAGDRYTIENVIREGIFAKMPANDQLTREEMKQLIDYLYQLRGHSPQ